MKAYDEVRTTNPDNAYSNDIEIAFDKANRYDDMRNTLIGIRNSAWALRFDDQFSAKLFYHLSNAILTDDKEMIGIMVTSTILDV